VSPAEKKRSWASAVRSTRRSPGTATPRAIASSAGSVGGATSRGSGTAGASGYTLKRKGLFAQSSVCRSVRTLARECFVSS
jgi:hypothetical protein